MTEAEWMASDDPAKLLAFGQSAGSLRKLRLFGVACARRVWALLPAGMRAAVEVAERYADGDATVKALAEAKRLGGAELASEGRPQHIERAFGVAWSTTRDAATAGMYPCWVFTEPDERGDLIAYIRDIFGNPFRPVAFDPGWRTEAVVGLAAGIYADRAFDRLPVLADALEDAGCADPDLLAHCRGPGPHVRGCWAVDLVLGKT